MRILICGCLYGAGNIGDEAILAGILELLPADAEAGVCIAGSAEAYHAQRLRTFPHSKPALLRALLWADVVLLGGGSLLTDPMGSGYPINHCAFILSAARALGRPSIFIGIGATQLNLPESVRIARRTYDFADKLFVRNEASKAALVGQLGIVPEKVFPMADPAFLLAGKIGAERGRLLLLENGIQIPRGRRLIGVSVVNEGFERGRDYHRQLAAACDALWAEHDCELVFIHSEVREDPQFDQAAAAAVRTRMSHPSQVLPAHFYPPIDFAAMLANFDCVIAMRMHVVILSALSGVPSAPIVREPKVTQTLDDLGITGRCHIDSVTAEEIVGCVNQCLTARGAISRALTASVSALASRCRDEFNRNMTWHAFERLNLRDRLLSQFQLLDVLLRSAARRLLRRARPVS